MEIFGMGPAEMVLILVIALIVFGPGKLPEIGAAIGRAIGDFRRASRELTADLQTDLVEAKSEVEGTLNEIQGDVQGTINTAHQEVTTISREIKALPSGEASLASGTTVDTDNLLDEAEKNWLRLGLAADEGGATTE